MISKRGASLVELIAVILILGIIAAIAVPTVLSVIDRQKKNAIINSLNGIYKSAKDLLVQVATESYDPNITLIDEDFCYISLTTLIESGNVDGNKYKPTNGEVYFCYNFDSSWVAITEGGVAKEKPSSAGTARVNELDVSFDYTSDEFIVA